MDGLTHTKQLLNLFCIVYSLIWHRFHVNIKSKRIGDSKTQQQLKKNIKRSVLIKITKLDLKSLFETL